MRAVGSEETSSSRHGTSLGDDGGMILYVMRTFFALRHMGSVECVTDHVPSSHSSGGACQVLESGTAYLMAGRMLMSEVEDWLNGFVDSEVEMGACVELGTWVPNAGVVLDVTDMMITD